MFELGLFDGECLVCNVDMYLEFSFKEKGLLPWVIGSMLAV